MQVPRHKWLADTETVDELGHGQLTLGGEDLDRAQTRDELIRQDIRDLHKLGYAQQLFREMGGFSNFAISFSIISVLTGSILLYGYGLKSAGPIINTVG